jgi:hypothetical protein
MSAAPSDDKTSKAVLAELTLAFPVLAGAAALDAIDGVVPTDVPAGGRVAVAMRVPVARSNSLNWLKSA